MFWGFQTLLCQQLICPSHVTIAQLMSVTVLSLQTRLCFLSVTSLSLHRTRTRVSVPLLSLQCAIVTWQTLCNDSNSSTQVCDGNSEIGQVCEKRFYVITLPWTVQCRYNAVNFLPNPHNRHPIAHPWERGMGWLLWVWYWIIWTAL